MSSIPPPPRRADLFRWACLAVATAFLAFLAWVLNDVRVEVRRTSRTFDKTAESVNENLPAILEKTRKATDALGDDVPEIVSKTRTVANTLDRVAAEVRQLEKAAARMKTDRDPVLVEYADSVLATVEASGAVVGIQPLVGFGSLANQLPARAWVARARDELALVTLLARSKLAVLAGLTSTPIGAPYLMRFADGRQVAMLDWLKDHHAETTALFE